MNNKVDDIPGLLSDVRTAESLMKNVKDALENSPSDLNMADGLLERVLALVSNARAGIARSTGSISSAPHTRGLSFNRYQLTVWLYDKQDEFNPGLIAFEFVNYGYNGAEFSGLLEIRDEEDPALAQSLRAAVLRLAGEEALPLTVGAHPDWQSGTVPITWKVLIATGSITDFVLWVELETDSGGECTTLRSGHLQGTLARRLQAEWDTILNAIMEREPMLLPIQHECSTCGADWETGEFSRIKQCVECDGFAKERMCRCAPECTELAIRDCAASHLNHDARTFPCAHSGATGINWSGDPWSVEALARKLKALAVD